MQKHQPKVLLLSFTALDDQGPDCLKDCPPPNKLAHHLLCCVSHCHQRNTQRSSSRAHALHTDAPRFNLWHLQGKAGKVLCLEPEREPHNDNTDLNGTNSIHGSLVCVCAGSQEARSFLESCLNSRDLQVRPCFF